MTRWLLISLLAVALVSVSGVETAFCELATETEARIVAENWLSLVVHEIGGWDGTATPRLGDGQEIIVGGTPLGWAYAVEPRGHVLVPALKELPPVKSYSDECDLDVTETSGYPLLVREVLESRARTFTKLYGALDAKAPSGGRAPGSRARAVWERLSVDPASFLSSLESEGERDRTQVGPLLTSSWHQSAPYNNFCPMGDGGRCVVGCVATAAAQVLHYYEWPVHGYGDECYAWGGDNSCGGTTPGEVLCADFSDPYDWDNIPDNCTGGCSSAEQNALAELNYEVGVAYHMDYGHCGSGAYTSDAVTILPQYFGYQDGIAFIRRDTHTAGSWFAVVQTEINASRPMLYSFYGSAGGHSIVCDGWRDTGGVDQYHMNYGWGGSYNIWFVVDDLYGSDDPMDERMVRRIEPDWPPSRPTDFTVTPDDSSVRLSWMSGGENDIDYYEIDRDTTALFGAGTFTFTSGITSCVDYPLANGRTYYYRVWVIDDLGSPSEPSDTLSCVPQPAPPSAPEGLSAFAADGANELYWSANVEPDISHYAVYRGTVPDFVVGAVLATSDSATYADTTAANYFPYYYRVAAVDTGGLESLPSDDARGVAHGVPATPTGLFGASGDSSAYLQWNDTGCAGLDRYDVYRDTAAAMLTPLFTDDFESYPVGAKPVANWLVIEETGTKCRVTDTVQSGGIKSLALADSTAGYTRLFHNLGDTTNQTATIEWKALPSATGGDDLVEFEVYGEKGMGQPIGVVEITNGWLKHWVPGEGSVALVECDPGEWHDFAWAFDCEADKYDLTMDGVPLVQGAPFFNSARYIDLLQLRTLGTQWGRAWVDDIFWAVDADRVASVDEAHCMDTGLENGVSYYYRVAAVDTFGTKSEPSVVVEVVPGGTGVPADEGTVAVLPSLSHSRPNPFRSTASLSYAVPGDGDQVTLTIYDVTGRIVRRLVDGHQAGGTHHLVWGGRDDRGNAVASGIYFCRISVGEWTASRKMVLVR